MKRMPYDIMIIMESYIATFYSHFGAMRFYKGLDAAHKKARMAPVPRTLSSSCGTCVMFEDAGDAFEEGYTDPHGEIEQIVAIVQDTPDTNGYRTVYRAKGA